MAYFHVSTATVLPVGSITYAILFSISNEISSCEKGTYCSTSCSLFIFSYFPSSFNNIIASTVLMDMASPFSFTMMIIGNPMQGGSIMYSSLKTGTYEEIRP